MIVNLVRLVSVFPDGKRFSKKKTETDLLVPVRFFSALSFFRFRFAQNQTAGTDRLFGETPKTDRAIFCFQFTTPIVIVPQYSKYFRKLSTYKVPLGDVGRLVIRAASQVEKGEPGHSHVYV